MQKFQSFLKLFGRFLESVIEPLAEIAAAASVTDAVTYKKMFGSGTTTLIILNEENNDIIKDLCFIEKIC